MEHEKYFVLNAEGRLHLNRIHNLNCIEGLKLLPDNCVDCCVTSPPYFGLRDYGTEEQIGMEQTPDEFVDKLLQVFTEVKRVLKPEGTLWLNLGDSYNGYQANVTRGGKLSGQNQHARQFKESGYGLAVKNLKPKDLIGVPWMVAFALRANGWYLRQDIIWHKPNPMPESVTDRCTKSHEYIFLMSKSQKYYYDADSIKPPLTASTINRVKQDVSNQTGSERVPGKTNGNMKAVVKGATFGGNKGRNYTPLPDDPNFRNGSEQWGREYQISEDGKANKKSVWTVTTKPFRGAHFATFPEDLIVDCIKAGCPVGGVVLDPFMGAGTTAMVSRKLDRNYIGFELNKDYISIANKRLHDELGFFL